MSPESLLHNDFIMINNRCLIYMYVWPGRQFIYLDEYISDTALYTTFTLKG